MIKMIDSFDDICEEHDLEYSWGNTPDPDECYKQGLKDMYEAMLKEQSIIRLKEAQKVKVLLHDIQEAVNTRFIKYLEDHRLDTYK